MRLILKETRTISLSPQLFISITVLKNEICWKSKPAPGSPDFFYVEIWARSPIPLFIQFLTPWPTFLALSFFVPYCSASATLIQSLAGLVDWKILSCAHFFMASGLLEKQNDLLPQNYSSVIQTLCRAFLPGLTLGKYPLSFLTWRSVWIHHIPAHIPMNIYAS